jgi:SPP1 family predicted phage head-tail adaptor
MIGKLRNRITFKSKTGVSDGAGGYVNTAADYYTCWAEIYKETNDRTDIISKDSLTDNINFRFRYTTSKTFTNKLLISFRNRTYIINSIVNEGDLNKYYIIYCSTFKNG